NAPGHYSAATHFGGVIDDMIKEKLALKEQVDSLEQNLSKQIKEKECLLQTFTFFKSESKEKEDKYMENEIDLEKKIKELDNIIFKLVIDDKETLILEEKSRPKTSEKEKDPEVIKQNISHKPIDYVKLNRLSDDFGKRFTLQQELSAEQDFWLRMSNPTSKPYDASPVKIKAPKELPKVFKEQFDSIKKTRVRTKEHNDSLIDKMNLKFAENEDLKVQIQDKIPSANTIVPGMFKLDLEPLAPRLLQNREAHIDYLKYTQEQAAILQGIVEQAKAKQPLDNELDFAYKHAQRIQVLLVYVRDTCPSAIKLSAKMVAVTPKNNVKKVRFTEPLTSSSNIK
ncbi:hypothetical protein Tco_1427291, partial [Tanacetum coccineum]